MTYQQARYIAAIKRIMGWMIFLPALLSTMISLLYFAAKQTKQVSQSISAVVTDLVQLVLDVARFNTPFFELFWQKSPVPHFSAGLDKNNLAFFVIYFLIFVGMALNASSARMLRQVRYIREGLEDQMILEQMKGEAGRDLQQLEQQIELPSHTILRQYVILYLLPLFFVVMGFFLFRALGWMS